MRSDQGSKQNKKKHFVSELVGWWVGGPAILPEKLKKKRGEERNLNRRKEGG